MKKLLLTTLTFLMIFSLTAQKKKKYEKKENEYYDKYYDRYQEKDDKYIDGEKIYNSWSLNAYIGPNAIYTGDLMSDGDSGEFGIDLQISATKWYNHAFGVETMIQLGKTSQSYGTPNLKGNTKYIALNFNGILNLNGIFRRGDLIADDSERKWNAYFFAGVGFMKFKAKTTTTNTKPVVVREVENDSPFRTIHAISGAILSRRLTNNLDLNARVSFLLSGRDNFDGVHKTDPVYAQERLLTANIGLTYHFGKREKLVWTDPHSYKKDTIITIAQPLDLKDDDDDGVINQFDKHPNTPRNVIVDGSGRPLDIDKDGVYDGIDKCRLVKGTKNNIGCPEVVAPVVVVPDLTDLNLQFTNIKFDTNKSFIKSENIGILNNAAYVIKQYPRTKFMITGYTDCRGNDDANKSLSDRRAKAVKDYLIGKNVPSYQLYASGEGEDFPAIECQPCNSCSKSEHERNRRIQFSVINN
ncbi:MAG: OmpA family protein [Polaribacter sp.]